MMKPLRRVFADFPRGIQFQPDGWLRRQLRIQAEGLAGNLDRVWPDVRDSAWIGGSSEGWERVPYWLDGFIDLAWSLLDDGMIARARRYIDAILARQCADGWLCPGSEDKRGDYDIWSLFLLGKVLVVWERRSGDVRVVPALLKAYRQLREHIRVHPLKNWGRFRWYESLIALELLYTRTGESWLLDLVEELKAQGFDYPHLLANWALRDKETRWTYEGHVVNLAMAIHMQLLYQRFHPEDADDGSAFAKGLLQVLRRYHGMAHGHFTGDECLAGDSPIQGSELCSVVEAMFSEELLLAATGDAAWGDELEKLAFNALPAAHATDMWTHQYDQQSNQIACRSEGTPPWTTNGPDSHLFGLEPHYGCCTANFGQGWPKLAQTVFLVGDHRVAVAVPLPGTLCTEIDGVALRCSVQTDYPFRDSVVYSVDCAKPLRFALLIRVPGTSSSATLDGRAVMPGRFERMERLWPEGRTSLTMMLSMTPRLEARPRGLSALWRGPLLYALPIAAAYTRHEYVKNKVERKYPYCDYELTPTAPWNYAFATENFTVIEKPLTDALFSDQRPPVVMRADMRQIPWGLHPGTVAVAAMQPEPRPYPPSAIEEKELIPYGCTMLRMTEMPMAKS